MSIPHEKAKNHFGRLFFLYTSPTLAFLIVGWITEAVIRFLNFINFIGRFGFAKSTAAPESPSGVPCALGCLAAFGLLLLAIIPLYLDYDTYKAPQTPLFLLFAVTELHFFGCLFFYKIFDLRTWIFLPVAILTYPLAYSIMYSQFIALGSSPSQLGYLTPVASSFDQGARLLYKRYLRRDPSGRYLDGTDTQAKPRVGT